MWACKIQRHVGMEGIYARSHALQNEVFQLKISSVDVTKSAGNCGLGHLY